MGRSRIGWAAATVAPWCLAVGVLLSITAEAEPERASDASAFGRGGLERTMSPLRRAIEAASRYQAVGIDGTPAALIESRLVTGDPDDYGETDEIEPNRALKRGSTNFPDVERRGKGDPFIGLRPGFDARRRSGPTALDPYARFGGTSGRNPRDAEFDPDHTMSPVGLETPERTPGVAPAVTDGATPGVPLDFALDAKSPTPTDGVVVEIEGDAIPPQTTIASQSPLGGGKPDYATLIDLKDSARQMRCLAEAIYFEIAL